MSLAFFCGVGIDACKAHWAFDAINSSSTLASLLSQAIPMKAHIADDSINRTVSSENNEATNQKHSQANIAIGINMI